jgi:glycosyltransferase involved in cell wall biosynthesis
MKVAIMIPCYNEEITIGKVIDDFKRVIPEADIYVYDNNSKDNTSKIAEEHGAVVKREYRQGKGNVVRSMFRDIEADYYIMVDGDDTYPAEFVYGLIEPLKNGEADMTIGDRLSNGTYHNENKRAFHDLGNNLVRWLINKIFNSNLKDIMTGYRGFSREFVKAMPVLSGKFEIETEMSIHALDKKFLIKEVAIDYRDRPEGSESKLNTFSDGFKVLKTIFMLFKDYKPLIFFNIITLIFLFLGLVVGIPVLVEFAGTRYITKVPSAILAVGLVISSMLTFISGIILDTIVKHQRANYELYLNCLRKSMGEHK